MTRLTHPLPKLTTEVADEFELRKPKREGLDLNSDDIHELLEAPMEFKVPRGLRTKRVTMFAFTANENDDLNDYRAIFARVGTPREIVNRFMMVETWPTEGIWAVIRDWASTLAAPPVVVPLAVFDSRETAEEAVKSLRFKLARPLHLAQLSHRNGRATLTEAPSPRQAVIDPLWPSNTKFTGSRIVILPDGSPVQMLILLAQLRYPGYAPLQRKLMKHFPFWLDGDMRNEKLSNVGLAERSTKSTKCKRRA